MTIKCYVMAALLRGADMWKGEVEFHELPREREVIMLEIAPNQFRAFNVAQVIHQKSKGNGLGRIILNCHEQDPTHMSSLQPD